MRWLLILLCGCRACRVAPGAGDDSASDDTGQVDVSDDTADTDTDTDSDSAGGTGDDTGVCWADVEYDTAQPAWEPSHDGLCSGSGEPGVARTVVVLVPDGARLDETFSDLGSAVSNARGVTYHVAPGQEWTAIKTDLVPRGALVLPGYATGATNTGEGHAELLTGLRVPQATWPDGAEPGLLRPEIPTLFEEAGQGASNYLTGNTEHLGGHTWSLYPGLGEGVGAAFNVLMNDAGSAPLDEDVPVIDDVRTFLDEHDDVRLVVANLHQMDRSGHNNDDPRAYPSNVDLVDEPIVQLYDWLQSDERYAGQTTLVVVADHGRHRTGECADQKHHGDSCLGCRQVPMVLVGAGIEPGVTVTDELYTLQDLGTTIAWLLGVDLPNAAGRVMCGVLSDPPGSPGPLGAFRLSRAGGLLVVEDLVGEADRSSRVDLEGVASSSAEALHAEAPVVTRDGDDAYACWRELSVNPDVSDATAARWPWVAHCEQAHGGPWEPLLFPIDEVSPFFRPGLAADGDTLYAAFVDNETANWEAYNQAVRLAVLESDAWAGADQGVSDVVEPLDPSIALVDGTPFVAFADSYDSDYRYSRHIEVYRVAIEAGVQTWSQVFANQTSSGVGHYERMEHPELVDLSGELRLGFVAWDEVEGATVVAAATENGGETWTSELALDDSGAVLGHVGVAWTQSGRLAWTRLVDGVIELCLATPGSEASCGAVEGTAVGDIDTDGETVLLTLRGDDGAWSVFEGP